MPIFSNIFTTPEYAAEIDSLDYHYGNCIFNINIPYRFTSSIVSFWLPCTGMIIFYILVMRRAIQIESVQSEMYNSIATYDPDNKQQNSVQKKMWRREYKVNWHGLNKHKWEVILKSCVFFKALKTLGTVIGIFVLCWIFFFFRLTFCWKENFICTKEFVENQALEDILFWFGYFSSMINPFLYNFTHQDFRRAFRSLLRIKKKSKKTLVR